MLFALPSNNKRYMGSIQVDDAHLLNQLEGLVDEKGDPYFFFGVQQVSIQQQKMVWFKHSIQCLDNMERVYFHGDFGQGFLSRIT